MSNILLKRSNVVDASGNPKLPEASVLQYGELAVNYAAGAETLSIKNSNDEIVTFSSDNRSGGGSSVNPAFGYYGVYIQATDKSLYRTDDWDRTKKANGIAVINNNVRLLLSLSGDTKTDYFRSYPSVTFDTFVSSCYTNTCYSSTGGYADSYCLGYKFPNGETGGYLGTYYEYMQIFSEKDEVEKALKKVGGESINSSNYFHTCNRAQYNNNGTLIYIMALIQYFNISVSTTSSRSDTKSGYARPIKKLIL